MPILRRSTFRRPNVRDLQVHEQVLVLGRTQAEVARELKVSQPMVAKIVRRMRDFHGVATEAERGEPARVACLQEHLRVRVQRMDHLYSEAMAGWRRSQEKVLSVKTVDAERGARKEQSLKVVHGDYRFLKLAAEMDDRKLDALERLYDSDPVYAENVMLDQQRARLQLPRDYDEKPKPEELLAAMAEATSTPVDVIQEQIKQATTKLEQQEAAITAACAAERGVNPPCENEAQVRCPTAKPGHAMGELALTRELGATRQGNDFVRVASPACGVGDGARAAGDEPDPQLALTDALPPLADTGASLRSSPGHDVAVQPVKKVCPLVAPRLQSRAVLLAHGLNPEDYGGGYEGYDIGRRVCDYPEDLAENAERERAAERERKRLLREKRNEGYKRL